LSREASRREEELGRKIESAELADRGGEDLFRVLRFRDRQGLAEELMEYRRESEEQDDPRLQGKKEEPEESRDLFADLLLGLSETGRIEGTAGLEEIRTKPGMPSRTRPIAPMGPVQITKEKEIVLNGLSGDGNDIFNRYMTAAKSWMDKGQFYKAARFYRLAVLTRPGNPIGRLGLAMARFGCGEWYASGVELQRTMEIFPAIMEVKVRLAKIMPEGKLKKRIQDLDQWIASVNKEPSLLFLSMFVKFNSDMQDDARKIAAQLLEAEDVPDDVKTYAEYILTGKRKKAAAKGGEKPAIGADKK
jgi:hypothetical protein